MRSIKRQRGFATLIIIGIAAAFIVGGIGAFALQMRNAGKAAGIAQEEPKTKAAEVRAINAETRVQQLNSELTSAVEINKRNLVEVETLRARFAETKKTLDDIARLQDQQQEKTRTALATFTVREKRQAAEIRRLNDIASGPQVTITDGGLSEADTILRTAIRDILGLREPAK